jgi:eukaryotic-like serine/threonine-protein kinase
MVSDEALRFISEVFIGDVSDCYSYKSGSQLVDFFNQNFGFKDIYQSGFPSRWRYVLDKLKELNNQGKIDEFFTLILSKRYLMKENKINEIEALEKRAKALELFNEQLQYDGYQLIQKDEKIVLINEDEDLELIGKGGFALVYYRKSDNKVLKKLKDENILDPGIRSRFKREYEITKSLQDIDGIIKLYSFNENKFFYEMEKADYTLSELVMKGNLSIEEKFKLVLQLMKIMSKVHERNIIHRDLSPSNILFVGGEMKIADFGLGKNFETIHSHQTMFTNAYGQFHYCSPEQMYALKDGDKRSDVFSLGKIINFIFTGNPNNQRHELSQIVNKATSEKREDRYESAVDMLQAIEELIQIIKNSNLKEVAKEHIRNGELTPEVIQYINNLTGKNLCVELVSNANFKDILIDYMKLNLNNENHVINEIGENFQEACPTFESYDPIALFAYSVLQDNFAFLTKEKSAKILSYIAYSVNRFSAQRMIEKLITRGVEPLIENVLQP